MKLCSMWSSIWSSIRYLGGRCRNARLRPGSLPAAERYVGFASPADAVRAPSRAVTVMLALLILLPAASSPLLAHGVGEDPDPAPGEIAPDPNVLTGRLLNGLTYYIRENEEPEERASFRLAVNAGSIVEEEDEQGLAHFVEHMAFQGTDSFTREEITGYLERIGMRFGPHINAYVSFDETVYRLRVPTDEEDTVTRALEIMSEWADRMAFEKDRVEHERDVIKEEWRLGLGADQRVRDEILPTLLHDSRYAERLPIGDLDVVREAPPEQLIDFYERWYRPEHMAVVAVGDFDKHEMRSRIAKLFGRIPTPEQAPRRPVYSIPEHNETLFAVAEDPELSQSSVTMYDKRRYDPARTVEDYREHLVERLYREIMDRRLRRLGRTPDAPFVRARSASSQPARPLDASVLTATVEEHTAGHIEEALTALKREAVRIQEHGITEPELDRARRTIERGAERQYRQRDDIDSESFATDYVEAFLENALFPSQETRYELTQELLPKIRPDEVAAVAEGLVTEENRVVTVGMVEGEEQAPPDEASLRAALEAVDPEEVEPPDEDELVDELTVELPEPGRIEEEIEHEEVSVHEWHLSNGITVLVRPTDYRTDDVRMSAYAPGGASRAEEEQVVNAELSAALVAESGVGEYSSSELEDLLAGQDVSLSPYVQPTRHGLRGSSGADEVLPLLQLAALYLTEPRRDEEAFERFRRELRTNLQNQEAQPQFQFQKRFTELLWDGSPRRMPLTLDRLEELDMERAYDFYESLFDNPGELTFTIVGDVDKDELAPLIEEYLAAVPGEAAEGDVVDHGDRYAEGVRTDQVQVGIAPQSIVSVVFHGDHTYEAKENHRVRTLAEVLERRLRELLREEIGGVYALSAHGQPMREPWERYVLEVAFGADPEKASELAELVHEELAAIRDGELDESYVEAAREAQRSDYEEGIEDNQFWLSNLEAFHRTGRDFADIHEHPERIERISTEMVTEAAGDFLDPDQYIQVLLLPAAQQ